MGRSNVKSHFREDEGEEEEGGLLIVTIHLQAKTLLGLRYGKENCDLLYE